jgi:serine protease Do
MCCAGKWATAFIVATIAIGAGFVHFTPVEAAQQPDAKDAKDAKETKLDLTALREAVDIAAKRGENVDEIRKALDVFAKVTPTIKVGTVPPELQALRDAVDAAARKGENVEAIAKELLAVEMIVTGKSLTKPRPEPKPNPNPNPLVPFPNVPFPLLPNPGGDNEVLKKVLALRLRALELWNKNPRDPEALKLWEEADALFKKAGGGAGPAMPIGPLFPEIARVPDRARFGIRMERVPAVAAEQLGLEPNTGIVVTFVMPNSAAEKAGIKMYDIILEFGGKPVSDNLDDFIRRVNEAKAGEKIDVVVLRKGKKVEVKGVELPEVQARPVLPPLAAPALPNLPIDQPRAKRSGARVPLGFSVTHTTNKDKGTFELKASKDTTLYLLSGTINDEGIVTLTHATIEVDGKIHIAESLDKVDEAHRPNIVKLLQVVERRLIETR